MAYPMFDIAALEAFYAAISAQNGIDVSEFLDSLDELFNREIAFKTAQGFAERVGRYKKLADEVVPIADFLRAAGKVAGRIRFPLDDQTYDAWFQPDEGGSWIGIEATLSLARGRVFLAKYRRAKKVSPGFLGIPDNSKKSAFAKATARPRTLHSREGVEKQVVAGIRTCLENKSVDRYTGGTLLISAELMAMPDADWDAILDVIRLQAKEPPFDQIYVIDDRRDPPVLVRLK